MGIFRNFFFMLWTGIFRNRKFAKNLQRNYNKNLDDWDFLIQEGIKYFIKWSS